ncbi:MAG: branched-chain amino acid ABC transporter permease [Pseudomonadota bacterium]|nr:branched-chain amino acid ABC transporter permease [Pseudomonadota bacterium]
MTATIILGLSIAMLLFLLTSGLTLIFGMLGVINFAHGALYMLGAYLAYQIGESSGSFTVALVLTPLALAVVGFGIERWLLRPLYARDHVEQFLMTFGLILVINEVVRIVWGFGYVDASEPAFLSGAVEIAGSQIPVYRFFLLGVGVATGAALWFMIDRTRLGIVLRAAMTHPEMVRSLGIQVDKVRTLVFCIGAGLAGLAGAVAAPILPIQLGMGFSIIIDCFVVVILGGLGDIRGAFLAAILLGAIQTVGQQYYPEWTEIGKYVLLLLVLMLRPEGIFSRGSGRLA